MAEPATPQVAYIEMTQPQASATFGKMAKGKVYPMSPEQAGRFIGAGVAKASSEDALESQRNHQARRIEDRHSRAGEFAALNQESDALWDVSTARDVTTAPEEGLRAAFAAGRLVNTDRLMDEDGHPLPPDADLEQIIEARNRLGYNEAPFAAHDRSSVMGGGQHTHQPGGVANEGSTLMGAQPLNAPSRKLTQEQLGNGPSPADAKAKDTDDDSDEAPARGRGRARS